MGWNEPVNDFEIAHCPRFDWYIFGATLPIKKLVTAPTRLCLHVLNSRHETLMSVSAMKERGRDETTSFSRYCCRHRVVVCNCHSSDSTNNRDHQRYCTRFDENRDPQHQCQPDEFKRRWRQSTNGDRRTWRL